VLGSAESRPKQAKMFATGNAWANDREPLCLLLERPFKKYFISADYCGIDRYGLPSK
jgi:hypothetical protein